MLDRFRRLYRGLCWLMDTECGMPYDMADLGDVRAKVAALPFDIAALAERLAALEQWIRSKELSERQADWEYDEHGVRLTPHSTFNTKPVICSPLTKMGLTATTDDQFYAMAEYVVQEAGDKPSIALVADALQAYAKGDR
jgi:hypothetical protein